MYVLGYEQVTNAASDNSAATLWTPIPFYLLQSTTSLQMCHTHIATSVIQQEILTKRQLLIGWSIGWVYCFQVPDFTLPPASSSSRYLWLLRANSLPLFLELGTAQRSSPHGVFDFFDTTNIPQLSSRASLLVMAFFIKRIVRSSFLFTTLPMNPIHASLPPLLRRQIPC